MPVWVAFSAFLYLKEQLTSPRVLATIGGFIGVLGIVWPSIGMVDPAPGLVLMVAAGYVLSLIFVHYLMHLDQTQRYGSSDRSNVTMPNVQSFVADERA